MPIIRINADHTKARIAPGQGLCDLDQLTALARAPGPVIVMIHGFKYLPGDPDHCPHRKILAASSDPALGQSWPRRLGFDTGHAGEGLGVAFGWNARGALWAARDRAVLAGQALADIIARIHQANPGRPIHILAHSMGTEVAAEAIRHLPPRALRRVVSMTGACYRSRVQAALDSPCGRQVEFFNMVSRENDAFDFLYERLITPPVPKDRTLGHGLDAPNAVTMQIDGPATLDLLDRLGHRIAPPQRRICHWSSYTRPGIMRFYTALVRRPEQLPLHMLRQSLPPSPDPMWSRLLARPALGLPRGIQPRVS